MPTWKLFDFRIRRDQRDGSPKILSFLLQINIYKFHYREVQKIITNLFKLDGESMQSKEPVIFCQKNRSYIIFMMILGTIFKTEQHFAQYFHHFTVINDSMNSRIHISDWKWHSRYMCRSNF